MIKSPMLRKGKPSSNCYPYQISPDPSETNRSGGGLLGATNYATVLQALLWSLRIHSFAFPKDFIAVYFILVLPFYVLFYHFPIVVQMQFIFICMT